jgi:hypothetical protein
LNGTELGQTFDLNVPDRRLRGIVFLSHFQSLYAFTQIGYGKSICGSDGILERGWGREKHKGSPEKGQDKE